ncbi:MAG: spore coat protein [Flavonifractor plautii]
MTPSPRSVSTCSFETNFSSSLNQGHQTQTKLFQTAQQKGWYQVEQAPASQIGTAYTRFSNQRPQ